MIEWNCPSCLTQYTYNGVQEKNATSKCSNSECTKYRKTVKIWYHKCTPKYTKKLHPPRAPPKVEKSSMYRKVMQETGITADSDAGRIDSKTLGIDFSYLDPGYQKWALSLETQRHYYYTKFGKVHRKNSIEVKKDLKVKNQELDMVELMKKSRVGLYRDCMNELKEVLEMRKK